MTKINFKAVLSSRGYLDSDRAWETLCDSPNTLVVPWITLREFDPEAFAALSTFAGELLALYPSFELAWHDCFTCSWVSFDKFLRAIEHISNANAGVLYAWLADLDGLTEISFLDVMRHWQRGGQFSQPRIENSDEKQELTEQDTLNAAHFLDWARVRTSYWKEILIKVDRGITRKEFINYLQILRYARPREVGSLFPDLITAKTLHDFKKGVETAGWPIHSLTLHNVLLQYGGSLTSGFLNLFGAPLVGEKEFCRILHSKVGNIDVKRLWNEFQPTRRCLHLGCVDNEGVMRQRLFVNCIQEAKMSVSQAWQKLFNPKNQPVIDKETFMKVCQKVFSFPYGALLWKDLFRQAGMRPGMPWMDFSFLEFWEKQEESRPATDFFVKLKPKEFSALKEKKEKKVLTSLLNPKRKSLTVGWK